MQEFASGDVLERTPQQETFFEQSTVIVDGKPMTQVRIRLETSKQEIEVKQAMGATAFERLVRFSVAFLDGQDVGSWPDGGPGLSEDAKVLLGRLPSLSPSWKDEVRWTEEPSFFSSLHTILLPKLPGQSHSTFARGSSMRTNLRRFAKTWVEEIYGTMS